MRTNLSWLFVSCAVAALAGCPAPDAEPPPPPAPRVLSFSATPGELPEGGKVTLKWETQNAESVEIVDASYGTISGTQELSGSIDLQVDRTSLFILTAHGTRGRTDTAIAQVRAGPGDSEVLLVAQPSVIARGEPVTLAWAVARADDVHLSTSDGEPIAVESPGATGSVVLYPEADTTYVLKSHGRTTEVTVRLRPDIVRFEATPKGAVRGEPIILSWETSSATSVRIEDREGTVLHSTNDAAEVASGSFSVPVSAQVDPDSVFNFRLIAEGSIPEANQTRLLTVYVAGRSRILSFDAGPFVRAGASFPLSWTTVEADKVVIFANGKIVHEAIDQAAVEQGSTMLAAPTEKTTYTLRATSVRGGEAEVSREVGPTVTTTVVSAGANPTTIANGGEPVTLSWNITGARRVRVEHSIDGTVFTGFGEEAEQQDLAVYPNASGTYEIIADNTLGDEVRIPAKITVTTPAKYDLSVTGPIVHGDSVTVSPPGATSNLIYGFSHSTIDVEQVNGIIDISATATRSTMVPPADTPGNRIRLPFEFWLYGERVKGEFLAYTDGVLVFQPYSTSKGTPMKIPGSTHEPRLIAPFWSDLQYGTSQSIVMWEVRGDAPNQVLIVHWEQMQVKGEPKTRVTFQAQIHQNGVIRFAYADGNVLPTVAVPTIGVQGPMPELGLAYAGIPGPNEVLTFFGPRNAVDLVPDRNAPYTGFVQIDDAYLRVTLDLDTYVAPGQLAITEAMPAPHASLGTAGQWIEVTNGSRTPVDLAGWTLRTPTTTHDIVAGAGSTIVPAGGTLVLGGSTVAAQNGGAPVSYEWPSTFTLDSGLSWVGLEKNGYASTLDWASSVEGQSRVIDTTRVLLVDDASATPTAMACAGSTPFGDPALEQLGGPGQRNGCFGYRMEERPVSYRDISLTGVQLVFQATSPPQGPAVGNVLPVGGTAKVFGTPVTSIGVSRRGYVTFNDAVSTATTGKYPFSTLPTGPTSGTSSTPDFTAAVMAGDLSISPVASAGVYAERIAAGEDPENPVAHWIIQWHHVTDSTTQSAPEDLNFQLKLFDDGVLEYHYGYLSSYDQTLAGLGFATVTWLENKDGSAALPVSVQSPSIRPYTAIRFIPE